jgi:ferrous iron transport protein A
LRLFDRVFSILRSGKKGRGRTGDYAMAKISLRRMKKGQSGAIAAVKVTGILGLRLREMGMIPGTSITVTGRAPFNDPVAVRVLDCTVTLRNNEADCILVDV